MIRYFSHNEIDKEKWNNCVRTSLYPTLFADFDFLTAAAPAWGALVEDDYEKVMPLPARSKFSVDYIFTPYGFVRLGIFAKEELTESEVKNFVDSIPQNFKQIDLFMNPKIPYWIVKDCAVEMVSHKLDLSLGYDVICRNFSENTRRNIKKSETFGLKLVTDITVNEIVMLFKNNKGKEANAMASEAEYMLFGKLAEYASRCGWAEVCGVCDGQGNLCAGAIFLKDYNRWRFWFSGRDFSHSESRPLFFLMNEFIKKHSGEPMILDFDGSRDENVARFYRGFGGERFTFPMLNISRGSLLMKCVELYRKVRRVF